MRSRAADIIREFEALQASKGNWMQHWYEIALRIDPVNAPYFGSFGSGQVARGEKRMQEVFDSTGIKSLNRGVAVLDSLLVPLNEVWHFLETDNPELSQDRDALLYFEEVNRRLRNSRLAPGTNFISQQQIVWKNLLAYSTGVMHVTASMTSPGLRYRAIHLAEVTLDENSEGDVDRVWRKFSQTTRQLAQRAEFSGWRLPEKIKESLEKKPDKEWSVLHYVGPNTDRVSRRADYRGMLFEAAYISHDCKETMWEGGHVSMPYIVSRYARGAGEVFGRGGPGEQTLPDVKTLNEVKKAHIKQIHRALDPPVAAPDDDAFDAPSFKPGTIIWRGVNKEGKLLVQPLKFGDVQASREMMEDDRNSIRSAYNLDLFEILLDRPGMTATEVLERKAEKVAFLYPILAGQQTEYLGPLLSRELDVLSQFPGILPDRPEVFGQVRGRYKIRFQSPLNRAQDASEAAGFLRSWQQTAEMSALTGDPSGLDHFNLDEAIPRLARINGIPESMLRSPEEVQAVRDGRQQESAVQQAIQAAPAGAAVIKALAASQKGGSAG